MHLLGTYSDGEHFGHPDYFSEYQGPFPYLFLTPKRGTSLSDVVSGRAYGLSAVTDFAEFFLLVSREENDRTYSEKFWIRRFLRGYYEQAD